MSKASIERIVVRQEELSRKVAADLDIKGFLSVDSKMKRRAMFYELVVEWTGVVEKTVQNQVLRVGNQAGIRIDLDILDTTSNVAANIYAVALRASAGTTQAMYRLQHYGFPDVVNRELPDPSDFKDFNKGEFQTAFDKIAKAMKVFAKLKKVAKPPKTERYVRQLPVDEEERYARNVWHAVHSLGWAATGKTLWLAREAADRDDFDRDVVDDVYSTLGARMAHHDIPRKKAWRRANRWLAIAD